MEREIFSLNLKEATLPAFEYEGARPVVEHLMARKSHRPPFSDGRKISGYFVGGFLTAVRGVGVAAGLQEAGLSLAFDELYGSSAGFLTASYFLTPLGASKALEFGRPGKISRNPIKLTDPNYFLKLLDKSGAVQAKSVIQHPTKLYARLRDVKSRHSSFVLANGSDVFDYETKLEAALSLPFLKPLGVKVNDQRLEDPLTRKDLLLNSVRELLAGDSTDIVLILSQNEQLQYLNKHLPKIFADERVLILPLDLTTKLKRFGFNKQDGEDWLNEAYNCERETKQIFQEKAI